MRGEDGARTPEAGAREPLDVRLAAVPWDRLRDRDARILNNLLSMRPIAEGEKLTRLEDDLHAELDRIGGTVKRTSAPATRFTTTYAIAWARAQGWRVVDRERWSNWERDGRRGSLRSHDLAGGSDLCALTPDGVRVWIQGAGIGERAEHRRRFEERRHLLARGERFLYLEFNRLSMEPARREDWA